AFQVGNGDTLHLRGEKTRKTPMMEENREQNTVYRPTDMLSQSHW
ncbi:unnamed protein product, partial [marine sediment metagenome]